MAEKGGCRDARIRTLNPRTHRSEGSGEIRREEREWRVEEGGREAKIRVI
jgi:hypothetical protein